MTHLRLTFTEGTDVDDPPLLPDYLAEREILRARWSGETFARSCYEKDPSGSGYVAELDLSQVSRVFTCAVTASPINPPTSHTFYELFAERHGEFEFVGFPMWLADLNHYLGFWVRGGGKRWERRYRWDRSAGPWTFEPHAYPNDWQLRAHQDVGERLDSLKFMNLIRSLSGPARLYQYATLTVDYQSPGAEKLLLESGKS